MRKIKRKKLKEPGDAQREVKLQFRIIEQEEFDDYKIIKKGTGYKNEKDI